MKVDTTDIAHVCPACHKQQECMTGIGRPTPGSFVLCFACRAWLVLEAAGLRLLRDGEWMALPVEARKQLTAIRNRVPVSE